jgi:hypothetical protein
MTRQYERPALPKGAQWGTQPARHGAGIDAAYIYPGRAVLELEGRTWTYTPGTCPRNGDYTTEWVLDGTVLICCGCGLDCT